MLSSSRFKLPVQRAADPVARLLLRARVRPNHLTVAGLGVSCLAAWTFADGHLRTGAALLTVAGLFDLFDGCLARLAGQDTEFGAFLDSVVDRYSDLVVLLGLVVYSQRIGEWTLCVFTMATVIGTVMVSYTKARAQSIGISCEIGIMERPERLIVLIAGAAFSLVTPAMAVLALLTHVTALQRIFYTRRVARSVERAPTLR